MDNSETSWSTDERSEESMANYWIDQMIDSYDRTAGLRHNIQTLAQISEEQNEITETQNQMREALQQAHQQRRQALQRRRQALQQRRQTRQQLRENERTVTEWQRQFFVTVLDTQLSSLRKNTRIQPGLVHMLHQSF
uniref:Uncharacterized protein n=1 Tax=Cacopsylla melanoneura TaxID=428564 RepID=A0A8D8ZFV4_9HEMI